MRLAMLSGLCGLLVAATCFAPSACFAQGAAPQFYAFGDSLVDNGNIPRLTGVKYPPPPYYHYHFSNGPTVAEYLPSLIGAGFTPAQDFGVGGALAGSGTITSLLPGLIGTADEIANVQRAGGRFAPGDTGLLWAGSNDYFGFLGRVASLPAALQAAAAGPQVQTTVAHVLADTRQLIALGARRLIVLGVPPLGETPSYNTGPQRTLANQLASAHDAALQPGLATIAAVSGANIYYINVATGFNQILANPAHYGLINTTQDCLTSACVSGTQAQQDQYLFWDGLHPTTGIHRYIAEVIANQIDAPLILDGQAQLTLLTARNFAHALTARLDARRVASSAQPWTIWLGGGYGFGHRVANAGRDGYSYDLGTVAIGLDGLVAPGWIVGGAFGYGNPTARFQNGAGSLGYDAYQLGAYVSHFARDYHLDAGVTYTALDGQASRPGVLPGDTVAGSPSGHAVSAGIGGGYVWRIGTLAYGPIAGLRYTRAWLDGYSETSADLLLPQHVDRGSADSLIGHVGARVIATIPAGTMLLTPYLDLQAEREFLNGSRALHTSFASAGYLPLSTRVAGYTSTYGRIGTGIAADITSRLAATFDLSTTFARRNGDDRSLIAKLRAAF